MGRDESVLIVGSVEEDCLGLQKAISSYGSDGQHVSILYLENKYYTAEIPLVTHVLGQGDAKALFSRERLGEYGAVILCGRDRKALELLDLYHGAEPPAEGQIAILALELGKDQGDLEDRIVDRCIEAEVELVNLQPDVTNQVDEAEEGVRETTGVARIIEALEAFQWPQMILKNASRHKMTESLEKAHGESARNRELFLTQASRLGMTASDIETIWSELDQDDEAYFESSSVELDPDHLLSLEDSMVEDRFSTELLLAQQTRDKSQKVDRDPVDDFTQAIEALKLAMTDQDEVIDSDRRKRAADLALKYLGEAGDDSDYSGRDEDDDDWGEYEAHLGEEQYKSLPDEP